MSSPKGRAKGHRPVLAARAQSGAQNATSPYGQAVVYREHPTRKHGVRPDRYFMVYYRNDGKLIRNALGWASEGWTLERARDVLAELRRNAKLGQGPKTLKEKRALEAARKAEEARRQALEAAANITFGEVWERYAAQDHPRKSAGASRTERASTVCGWPPSWLAAP